MRRGARVAEHGGGGARDREGRHRRPCPPGAPSPLPRSPERGRRLGAADRAAASFGKAARHRRRRDHRQGVSQPEDGARAPRRRCRAPLQRATPGRRDSAGMRFDDVCFPLSAAWSSPFARWQGPAAETNSLVLAESAAQRGLERSGVEWPIEELVLGQTVPQRESFYGPPTLAARLGFEHVPGPWIAQACATSVACIHAAAASQTENGDGARLVITTD